MKAIEITVDTKGNVTVATKGFAGGECRAASRDLERALGKATSERLTPEFYSAQQAERRLEQSQ